MHQNHYVLSLRVTTISIWHLAMRFVNVAGPSRIKQRVSAFEVSRHIIMCNRYRIISFREGKLQTCRLRIPMEVALALLSRSLFSSIDLQRNARGLRNIASRPLIGFSSTAFRISFAEIDWAIVYCSFWRYSKHFGYTSFLFFIVDWRITQ